MLRKGRACDDPALLHAFDSVLRHHRNDMGKPPMIRADMIPPEVVEALAVAWRDEMNSAHALAAALNAWPGSEYVYRQPHRRAVSYSSPAIILPLPQDASDD